MSDVAVLIGVIKFSYASAAYFEERVKKARKERW